MMRHKGGYHFPLLVALVCVSGLIATWLLDRGPGQAAPAPPAPPAPTAAFAGSEACADCHGEVHDAARKSPHGLLMEALEKKGKGHLCEGCHGPAAAHVADPSAETAQPLAAAAQSGAGCFQCHNTGVSQTDWRRSDHHRAGIACITCHGQTPTMTTAAAAAQAPVNAKETPDTKAKPDEKAPFDHAAFTRAPSSEACLSCHRSQRAEFAMPSHHPVLEGRVACVDCHQPHKKQTTRDMRAVCVTCHLKQRGPHRFEHGAISSRLTDGCLDCHQPHGAPNARLQKMSGRGLCLQCHADKVAHFAGRNCLDCHAAVHGSNSSPLLSRE